jgi:trans-2,3-dihydro-3-hydroxyanthranilate isomerase
LVNKQDCNTVSRKFYTLDVFTGRRLAGNPLAVVLDAGDLDERRMQAIAGEFNLSETVFVAPPEQAGKRARLRIFTPERELPFAGHPTVGTAVLLALLEGENQARAVDFDLEEKIGVVPCTVRVLGNGHGQATFTMPRLPERTGDLPDRAILARGLGLEPDDIGFGAYAPGIYSAGVPFGCVPLRSRAAVTRARPVGEAFAAAFQAVGDAYVYCAEPLNAEHAFHTRMFAPGMGITEDPATGSAAAAFAGAIMDFAAPADGDHLFVIEQGDAMGRPSRINLSLRIGGGALLTATIGGEAVIFSEGHLHD